ncbi:MAG: ABC transporter ATP-binding protein [Planctomycetes bacterium]|nr:ABC transporter ATP-binding protein [Planctomycetota bacterium]
MNPFWHFTRKMFRRRATIAWALLFAMISAGGLGVGLVTLGPMLKMILSGENLADLADQFNAQGHVVTVPPWLVALLPADPFDGIVALMAGILCLTVFGGFANFMHKYLTQALAATTVAKIRQEVFCHVIHLPLEIVVARGPTEFVARIVRDAAELQRGFIALTSKSVTQILKGSAALIAAFVFQPMLSLTVIVVGPILGIILRKLGKRIRRGTRGSLQAQEGLLRVATETMHGLRAVKVNTGERRTIGWFHRINKVVLRQELRVRTARAMTPPIVEIVSVVTVCGLAVFASRLILNKTLSPERFVLAVSSLGMALASFRPLASLLNDIQASAAPAGRLATILDLPREGSTGIRLKGLPRHRVSVEFEEVSYTYPQADRPAVQSICLTIKSGERVALVGPNGCGKTTLASLLPRLLEPSSGRVLIDGIDIATVDLRSLRRQISMVTQETVLFRGTVAENIAFGIEKSTPDRHERMNRIIDAARRAHADEFIRNLPNGYETDLAEQGASLSGGERQRLAIARAILRDPAILILDEATSQIDAESEAHINAALAEFCQGRTALLIAHRLSTVHNADRIVVMDDARIVAQGTHEQLLGSCELYQRLTRTQLLAPM